MKKYRCWIVDVHTSELISTHFDKHFFFAKTIKEAAEAAYKSYVKYYRKKYGAVPSNFFRIKVVGPV